MMVMMVVVMEPAGVMLLGVMADDRAAYAADNCADGTRDDRAADRAGGRAADGALIRIRLGRRGAAQGQHRARCNKKAHRYLPIP